MSAVDKLAVGLAVMEKDLWGLHDPSPQGYPTAALNQLLPPGSLLSFALRQVA